MCILHERYIYVVHSYGPRTAKFWMAGATCRSTRVDLSKVGVVPESVRGDKAGLSRLFVDKRRLASEVAVDRKPERGRRGGMQRETGGREGGVGGPARLCQQAEGSRSVGPLHGAGGGARRHATRKFLDA